MRDYESRARARRGTGSRLFGLVLLIWLAVGLLAANQRNHFEGGPPVSCAGWGTVAATALAGPLNYLGLNPKVSDCALPQPSE
ncbi:hypothetical protein [Nocardia sp. CNY236]|uniref:hypothetical protein n=1 Tax=Nocardia sp. CNY236 TaxID=1169152 RepID=UPI00040911D4|nr:hypothetical protein [Nocardia sp. CNY236]